VSALQFVCRRHYLPGLEPVRNVVVGESEDERAAHRDDAEEGKVGVQLEAEDGVEQIYQQIESQL